MLLILALSSSLAALTFFFLWTRKINNGGSLTPFFLTFLSFVVFNLIGLPFLSSDLFIYKTYQELELTHGLKLSLLTYAGALFFLLGAALTTYFSRPQFFRPDHVELSAKKMVTLDCFFVALLGGVSICAYFYFSRWNQIPLLEWINAPTSISNLRANVILPPQSERYMFALSYVLPLLSWYFVYRAVHRKNQKLVWLGLSLSVTLSLFVNMADMQKAPVIIFLSMTLIVFLKSKGLSLLSKPFLALSCAIVVLTVILFSLYNQSLETGALSALKRIFLGQDFAALFYLDSFPDKIPYLKGAGFANPGGVLPFKPFPYSKVLWQNYFGQLESEGLHGSLPSFYLMHFYINFGYLGALTGSFLTGAAVKCLSDLSQRISMHAVGIPISVLLAQNMMKLSMTNAGVVFLCPELFAAIFLILGATYFIVKVRPMRLLTLE